MAMIASGPRLVEGIGGGCGTAAFCRPALGWRKILQAAALKIQRNPALDLRGRDQIHAAGQASVGMRAEMIGMIAFIAITHRPDPVLPATAMQAAGQGSVGADELVIRISFPMRRFAASGDDDARPLARQRRFCLDRGCEVHQAGDRA